MSNLKTMPKLFITPDVIKIRKIGEECVNSLREIFDIRTASKPVETRAEFLALCKDQNAILAISSDVIDEEVVKAAGGNLKVVSISSAGYDRLNTDVMKKYGVRVGLAGSAITNAAAELAVTLLLCASRKLFTASKQYTSDPLNYFRQETLSPAEGLEDSTVGIIGAGRIGQSIAKKVIPFEIKRLLYYSRTEKDEMKKLNGELRSMEDIARESDYIVIALAHNGETDKIITKEFLNLMKPNAILVNIGRGGIVDQDALVEVLQNKKIGGAALDVTTPEPLPPDHPLLHLDNVLISPHLGGVTMSVSRKATDVAIRNIIAFFNHEPMPEELIL